MQTTAASILGDPPEGSQTRHSGEELRARRPLPRALDRQRRALFPFKAKGATQLIRRRKKFGGGEHFTPHVEHLLVRNRTIVEREDGDGIVERVEARDPAARATAQRERELPPVSPWVRAGMHDRRFDLSATDALHRIANDSGFCLELRLVRQLLKLTSPASIHHEVHAGGLNPLRDRKASC